MLGWNWSAMQLNWMNSSRLLATRQTYAGIWYAVDHPTNTVLAYVFGKRKDTVFQELKTLLTPFNIGRYYTDDWGAYERHLEPNTHEIGKTNTQENERKNLNCRT